jgi:CRP-like cAMP-binding protein
MENLEHNFEANFFTLLELLDPASRVEIEAACSRVSVPAHVIVYEQGEQAKKVYIVAAGVFEALSQSPDGQQTRSIGYMGRGDFFGDLAVLTNQPRVASVRACEDAQLLQIEKSMFLSLLDRVPKMGAYFSRNLARRLYKTSTQADLHVYTLDLSGNLRHFDLITIFHAILTMGRSGELHLKNSGNELVGSFFFRDGRAEHARFVHLEGEEAIWQGFLQSGADGTFTFRVQDEPILPFNEENRIERDGADLLEQGIQRRDAFYALPESLRQMESRLARNGDTLSWPDSATAELAERIWELIAKRPQPLASLWRRVNYSSLTFLTAINQLVKTGQAELSAAPPSEEAPPT